MRWTAGGSAPSARGREVLATHRYILRLKLLQNSLDLKNPIFATRCVGVGGWAAFEPPNHQGLHILVLTCSDKEAPLKENESNDIIFLINRSFECIWVLSCSGLPDRRRIGAQTKHVRRTSLDAERSPFSNLVLLAIAARALLAFQGVVRHLFLDLRDAEHRREDPADYVRDQVPVQDLEAVAHSVPDEAR